MIKQTIVQFLIGFLLCSLIGWDSPVNTPMSLESYLLPERKAWQGRCLVIVKSTKKESKITLSASAEGIPSSQLTITAE